MKRRLTHEFHMPGEGMSRKRAESSALATCFMGIGYSAGAAWFFSDGDTFGGWMWSFLAALLLLQNIRFWWRTLRRRENEKPLQFPAEAA